MFFFSSANEPRDYYLSTAGRSDGRTVALLVGLVYLPWYGKYYLCYNIIYNIIYFIFIFYKPWLVYLFYFFNLVSILSDVKTQFLTRICFKILLFQL
jgi:hypothetical protein